MTHRVDHESKRLGGAWSALTLVIALFSGCRSAGVIFEAPATPIVWPAKPEKTRIRYVGQLTTSADLKPAVGLGQGIGEFVFGKNESKSMLTPYAVCTDNADRVFVADSNAQIVHVFNLNTREYQQWTPDNPEKRFAFPVGIAWDSISNRLLVCDSVSRSIYAFDTHGKYAGVFSAGVYSRPCGMAFDPYRRRIFVADAAQHQIYVLSLGGQVIQAIGQRGSGLGQFNFPTSIAVDRQGRIYVSDSLNFRVQQFDANLKPLRQIGQKGDMPGYFAQPKGIALDSESHLFVIDANFEAIQIFNDVGRLLLNFGEEGSGPGEFWLPTSVYIDQKNRMWVADSYNRRIEVFDYIPEENP